MVVNKIATIIRELDNLSKNAFKNLKKSVLMCGVESAAELANRCLSALFWQEFTTYPLTHGFYTPVTSTCGKELKQAKSHPTINIRVPRWFEFNFTLVSSWCVLGMPGNNDFKTNKITWIFKKKPKKKKTFTPAGIWAPYLMLESHGCSTNWAIYM